MAQSKATKLVLEKGGKSISFVKPKVDPPAGFSVPSQKSVMDYFHQNSVVQKMYAERVISVMKEYVDGRTKLYPVHLNTCSDIVDFIFNNRRCKVNDTDTLAEDFLGLSLQPTPLQSKRKREKEDIANVATKVKALPVKKTVKTPAEPVVRKAKPEKVAKAEPVVGKFNISGRPRKSLAFAIVSIPNFLTFFPNSRVAVFSSKGGLHDSSCGICYEVGFYTAVDSAGVRRKLDLGQKAWVSTLHDLVDHEGLIPAGEGGRLLAVQRLVEKSVDMAVADKVEVVLPTESVSDRVLWCDTQPEGQES